MKGNTVVASLCCNIFAADKRRHVTEGENISLMGTGFSEINSIKKFETIKNGGVEGESSWKEIEAP